MLKISLNIAIKLSCFNNKNKQTTFTIFFSSSFRIPFILFITFFTSEIDEVLFKIRVTFNFLTTVSWSSTNLSKLSAVVLNSFIKLFHVIISVFYIFLKGFLTLMSFEVLSLLVVM